MSTPPVQPDSFTVEPPIAAPAPIVERPPLFTPEELLTFKALVTPLIGLDLDAYKPRQIERRITALMYRAKVTSLESFYQQLQTDPVRLKDFISGLTINVTEFFRNPERFEALGAEILPMLLARFGHIKVWSAGCSQGAELYSVGMLLEEMGALDRATLVGTDLDPKILDKAHTGLFHDYEVRAVPERFMDRYFEPVGALFRFHGQAIRERCTFRTGNLLDDEPEMGCHLVMCRNVVIYFNDLGKKALYSRVERALEPGGVLFVGNTERIFNPRDLGFSLLSPFFYQKALS